MMKKYKRTITFTILILLFILLINSSFSFAKTIDINGIKVSLTTEVIKKEAVRGVNVKDDNRFINNNANEDTNETKEKIQDEYVKVELSVSNQNPYETANVTIEEIPLADFKQVETLKNEKVIKFNLKSKSTNKYNYRYGYHKSFLKGQHNSILYDEDGNIIDGNKDTQYIEEDKKIQIESQTKGGGLEEEARDLRRGVFFIVRLLIIFVVCVILLMVFLMFYKTIKGQDDYYDNYDSFNSIIFFVIISFLINICFIKVSFAKSAYEPQIYEYGKSYEKVIYENVQFNDALYKFAYKITVSFDGAYEIVEEDYENDTDSDGLLDAFEYLYMTDKNDVDTDKDGLSDYLEVMFLDYNPLSDDTFKDGIKDDNRDFDGDKLTNIEEIKYNTDLFNTDTDYDTISDYDEVSIYFTNPLSTDTDEDLLSDPDEIKLGLDPLNPQTDGVTLDSERKIEQKYIMTNVPEELREGDIFIKNISGKVSGNIDKAIKVSKKNEELFNSMKSFVQSGFNIEMNDDEKIDIELDITKVSDRNSTLIIVKYENNQIVPIETVADGNAIRASIGKGTYSVMDSSILLKDLNIMIDDYMP